MVLSSFLQHSCRIQWKGVESQCDFPSCYFLSPCPLKVVTVFQFLFYPTFLYTFFLNFKLAPSVCLFQILNLLSGLNYDQYPMCQEFILVLFRCLKLLQLACMQTCIARKAQLCNLFTQTLASPFCLKLVGTGLSKLYGPSSITIAFCLQCFQTKLPGLKYCCSSEQKHKNVYICYFK